MPLNFKDSLANSTIDTTIVKTVLDRFIEIATPLTNDFSDEISRNKLQSDLKKQLIALNLSYLAVNKSNPENIDNEIQIKIRLLTTWIAEKYSESLKPFPSK